MKKYDTGRGFVPFLLCMAAVVAAAVVLPEIPAEARRGRGWQKAQPQHGGSEFPS